MLERLEKFETPRSWTDLVPYTAILIVAIAILAWLDSTVTPEQVAPQIPQQAGAAERRSVIPALSHPLGCPEEDVWGRKLHMTIYVTGQRKPSCIYTGEVKYK